jgi:hypothetical protein
MKQLFVMLCSLALLLVGACRNAPLTQEQARQIAETKFRQFCINHNLLTTEFASPTATDVGGAQFAFQWKDKAPGSDFSVLVSIDKDGIAHATYLGGRLGLPDPAKMPPFPK